MTCFKELGCLKTSTPTSSSRIGATYSTLHYHPLLSTERVKFVSAMAPAPLPHIPVRVQTLWS